MRHSARITTLEAIRVKHRISLFAICVLLLVSRALAQGDAAGGIPPFSTQLGGVYDLVDAASSRILVTVPVRSKNGKIPFPFRLVGNFHATVLCCNQGWGVTSYLQATPLAADLGVYTTSNTNLATRSGTCGSGYYAGFWLVDALGGFHPVNCTGQTSDGSGYTLGQQSGPGGVFPIWDKAGNKQTQQVQTGTLNSLTSVAVADPDGASVTEAFNPAWTPDGSSRGNGYSSGTITYTDSINQLYLTASLSGEVGGGKDTYSYKDIKGNNRTVTVNYQRFTQATAFGCGIPQDIPPNAAYFAVSISMPTGETFKISYEQTPGNTAAITGRIAALTLPNGGSITYTYSGRNNGANCQDGSVPTLTRTVTDTSGNVAKWIYTNSGTSGPSPYWSTTTIVDPQGNTTVYHFSSGYVTEKQVYQGSVSPQNLLGTDITCYNQYYTNCDQPIAPPFQPLNPAPVSQTDVFHYPGTSTTASLLQTKFNSMGLTTESRRYDFGATTSLPPCGPPNCNFPAPLSDEVVSYGSWNGSSCVSLPYLWDRGCDYVVTDASGAKVSETRYTYNVQGHATETSAWINGSAYLNSFASYSSNGTLSSATDVNGAITQYHYSGTGGCSNLLLTSTTYAVTSLSNSQTWNCSGVVPTSATDVNGNATQYGYVTQSGAPDPLWRMVSFTDQLGNTTYGTFTAASPTVSAKQESTMLFNNGASGVDVLSTLDSLGRPYLTQIRQAPGSSSFDTATVEYDLNGRLSKMHTPCTAAAASPCTSSLLTVTYDAMTRPSAISDAAGGFVSYSYPPAVGYKDVLVTVGPAPNGENVKKKQLEVDGLGRLISVCEITSATGSGTCGQVTQQPGYWTRYKYDALGRLIGVCQHTTQLASIDCIQSPSSGQQTRMFTYDGFGRVVSESNPESGRMQYFYDQAPATPGADCSTIAPNWAPPYNGDLVKKYDANGNTTCYTYDPLHRVLSMTYSGPNATDNKYFVYDGATVDAQSMSNAKGRLAEAYTATCQTCAKVTDVGFGYSKRGELTDTYELTPHSGKYYYINASYWANGALNVFNGGLTKLPGLPTFTYGIDGEGRTSAVSASSGVNPVLGTSYNGSSQVTSVTFGSNDSAGFTFDSNTGRMTQYKETINGTAMHGDLTWNANGSLESLAITDPFNTNDTQTCSYGYDDLTRLTSANCGSIWAQTFSYDAFGNLSKSGSLQWLPGYNQATNRYSLTGTSYDSKGNLLSDTFHTYKWDAEGRPSSIDSVSVTYDALGRMVEEDKSGSYTEFVYALGQKLALMNGQTLASGFVPLPGGTQVRYANGAIQKYKVPDWLGSLRIGSNPSRTFGFDLAFAPFGERYAQGGGTPTDFTFTGQNNDTVSDEYDFLFRELHTSQGRWISPDTRGLPAADPTNPQTWNRYAYAENNPLGNVDPLGEDDCDVDACADLYYMYLPSSDSTNDLFDSFYWGGGFSADPWQGNTLAAGVFGWQGWGAAYSVGTLGIPEDIQAGVQAADNFLSETAFTMPPPATTALVGTRNSSGGLILDRPDMGSGNGTPITYGTLLSLAAVAGGTSGGAPAEQTEALPEFVPGGKTSGILSTSSGDTFLVSGKQGPAASMGGPGSGFNAYTKTHVEGHAVALMHQGGITEAELTINNPVICRQCNRLLPRMLPSGAKLTVHLPDGRSVTFVGLP